jgi:hypothetical protein
MMDALDIFCRQVRARSNEHRLAMRLLHGNRLPGQAVSILRQELDSMVRVIFLLSVSDPIYRRQLVEASVSGDKWTANGKSARITDKEMVDLAQNLHGWTESVYKFGCAFVHLSALHDYQDRDPLGMIPSEEKEAILKHMRYYHGIPSRADITAHDLIPYLPMVFDKVSTNLECYLQDLESGEDLS